MRFGCGFDYLRVRYVHSRPILLRWTLPLFENLDRYVDITLSLMGSLYSSSYFSRIRDEVNWPAG